MHGIIILMKYITCIYSSKYKAILHVIAVSGRGMVSRFDFVLIRFPGGGGAVFLTALTRFLSPDPKRIGGYSDQPGVRPSVRPSVCPSVDKSLCAQ